MNLRRLFAPTEPVLRRHRTDTLNELMQAREEIERVNSLLTVALTHIRTLETTQTEQRRQVAALRVQTAAIKKLATRTHTLTADEIRAARETAALLEQQRIKRWANSHPAGREQRLDRIPDQVLADVVDLWSAEDSGDEAS